MATVTTRPASQIAQVGTANVGGAANRAAALADNLDATYVEYDANGDALDVLAATPSIPAGAVVKAVALRVRCRKAGSGNPKVSFAFSNTEMGGSFIKTITWTTPTTITIATITPGTETDNIFTHDPPWAVDNVDISTLSFNGNTFRLMEAYLDTIYVTKPVTTMVDPAEGSTLSDNNVPAVIPSWSVDPDGGPVSLKEFKIFSAAQYGAGGFDPSTSASVWSSGELDIGGTVSPPALPDGTYRAYGRAAQNVNGESFWGDWDYNQFTVSVNKPGVPTISVVADDDDGRIAINITDVAGAATTDFYEVQREVGSDWVTIYTDRDDGLIVDTNVGGETVYDYEPGNGETANYRARAAHDYGDGNLAFSAWSSQDSDAWSDPTQWWLKNPANPALNLQVVVRSQPGRQRTARQSVQLPMGRKYPVVIGDTTQADQGEIYFRTASEDESDDLDAFIDGLTGACLIQGPPEATRWHDRWVVLGDLSSERAIDTQWGQYEFEGFTWTEVDRPTGVIVVS